MQTTSSEPDSSPTSLLVGLAFGSVYLIWGSTYLAIRVAVETLPPFLMGGARFLIAGVMLFGLLLLRGVKLPTARQWRNAAVAGSLMLLGGNGLVVWAEQYVTSSFAALFIASAPVWFAVFDWIRPGGSRPVWQVWLGVGLGLVGVAMLVFGRENAATPNGIHLGGAIALLFATMCWASGSIFARHSAKPESPWMGAASQMLCGGAAMVMVAALRGELATVQLATFSPRSLWAFAYLVVFGSWVAYSAYVWLLKVSTPTRVSSYAYVNPVIAVFLGWALLGETLTQRMFVAMGVIVAAVVILTWPRKPVVVPTRRQGLLPNPGRSL
jgi:drug/metabolite transporter (DMT)-like permease